MNALTVGAIIDDKRIATFQVRADSDKIVNTLKEAGAHVYGVRWQVFVIVNGESVLVEWGDLTEEQQLRVLFQELVYMMQEMAEAYYTSSVVGAARETAKADVLTRYFEADE